MQNKALLVIDIQEDYTGTTAKPPFPYRTSEKLITTVNQLISKATERDIIIVYIKQEFESVMGKLFSKIFCGGTAIKGNPGTEIDKRINITSNNILSKPKADAFSNPRLQELLQENQVTELFLVGLDAAFCVNSTAQGAIKHGYKVSIVTDGIVLQKEKNWDRVLKQYQQNGIMLISSKDIDFT